MVGNRENGLAVSCLQWLHHPSGNRSRLGMSSHSAQMLNGMTGCVQTLRPKPKKVSGCWTETSDSQRTPSGFGILSGSPRQLRLWLQMLPAGQQRCEEMNENAAHDHKITTWRKQLSWSHLHSFIPNSAQFWCESNSSDDKRSSTQTQLKCIICNFLKTTVPRYLFYWVEETPMIPFYYKTSTNLSCFHCLVWQWGSTYQVHIIKMFDYCDWYTFHSPTFNF